MRAKTKADLSSYLRKEIQVFNVSKTWYKVPFEIDHSIPGMTGGKNDHHSAIFTFGQEAEEEITPEYLIVNESFKGKDVVVRLHSQCFNGDVFSCGLCDCGKQLRKTERLIEENGAGIILYLMQEGRGIGGNLKHDAQTLTRQTGITADEAMVEVCGSRDLRTYDFTCAMLRGLGLDHTNRILLVTDNMDKFRALVDGGFNVELTSATGKCKTLESAIEIVEKVLYAGYHESLLVNSGALEWIDREVQKVLQGEVNPAFTPFLKKIRTDFDGISNEAVQEIIKPVL